MTLQMLNSAHPGEFIRSEILRAYGLSTSRAALILGVTRQALTALIHARTSLSGEMALRIEKAFGIRMDTLLQMQANFHIAQTRRRAGEIRVERYRPVSAG